MTTPPDTGQPWQPRGLDHAAQRRAIQDARRAGIDSFRVQALVHSGHRLLLHHDRTTGSWLLPATDVRPADTVPDTLDELCSDQLRLELWDAYFLTTTVCQVPDGGEVLQFAFKILALRDDGSAPSATRQWWDIHAEAPRLHALSRPVLEQLYGIPPET